MPATRTFRRAERNKAQRTVPTHKKKSFFICQLPVWLRPRINLPPAESQGAFTRQSENGTDPTKTGTVPCRIRAIFALSCKRPFKVTNVKFSLQYMCNGYKHLCKAVNTILFKGFK